MMIKLNLAGSLGPVILNPAHIVAVTQSSTRPVQWVLMTDGKAYEVKESIQEIWARFPRGGE